jgi:serine/threonine protein kinase
MAPELADMSRPIDIRADLYSLGLVMLEMLFGKTMLISEQSPAPGINIGQWRILWHTLENHGRYQKPLLDDLESLLRSMIDTDIARRPVSAEHLVRRLISLELAWI